MRTVYNLEYKVVDKLGRQKSTHHVGIFATLEDVSRAQQAIILEQPNVIFDIYTCEHIFS